MKMSHESILSISCSENKCGIQTSPDPPFTFRDLGLLPETLSQATFSSDLPERLVVHCMSVIVSDKELTQPKPLTYCLSTLSGNYATLMGISQC